MKRNMLFILGLLLPLLHFPAIAYAAPANDVLPSPAEIPASGHTAGTIYELVCYEEPVPGGAMFLDQDVCDGMTVGSEVERQRPTDGTRRANWQMVGYVVFVGVVLYFWSSSILAD